MQAVLMFDWFRRKETFQRESLVLRLPLFAEKTTITEVYPNIITVVRVVMVLPSFKNNNFVLCKDH